MEVKELTRASKTTGGKTPLTATIVLFGVDPDSETGDFPDTVVYGVEVATEGASWEETYRTEAEVEAFLSGLSALASFSSTFPPLDLPPVPRPPL